MNNLRISILSLTLAIAVITLGYANSSFAGPDCEKHPSPWVQGGGPHHLARLWLPLAVQPSRDPVGNHAGDRKTSSNRLVTF